MMCWNSAITYMSVELIITIMIGCRQTHRSLITPNSQPSSAMVNMSRQDFWDTFDKQDNLFKILVLEEILPREIVVLRGIRVLSVDVQDLILMIEAIREILMAKRN
jgi:hypothetical protein